MAKPRKEYGLDRQKLAKLKYWFADYVRSFCLDDPMHQRNFILKEEHSRRVGQESLIIGRKIGLDAEELLLSETIALLHDIGRFEQYARYKTFVDIHSENHAELGISILSRYGTLDDFDTAAQHIIVQAIRHHNRAALPRGENGEWLQYARLLRDADKLDIWRVVTEYYDRSDDERNEAIELGLPDTPEISEQVLQDLSSRAIVQVRHLRTLNDFKLLQMGWVFDINFTATCRLISERGYLQRIRTVLPANDDIDGIYNLMRQHLAQRISSE